MQNIYVLIGPPLSGKDTQGELLEISLGNIPRFSIGHLIREARKTDEKFEKAFHEYSMQGKHLPTSIYFPILEQKMNTASSTGFILDNFPATAENVEFLEKYLMGKNLILKAVVVLGVSDEEMKKRFEIARMRRGRADDTIENVEDRRAIQDRDRISVLDHYEKLGLLKKINGEQSIEKVQQDILQAIGE